MIEFIKKIFARLFSVKKEVLKLKEVEETETQETGEPKSCENHSTYANRCGACRELNK